METGFTFNITDLHDGSSRFHTNPKVVKSLLCRCLQPNNLLIRAAIPIESGRKKTNKDRRVNQVRPGMLR